MSNYSLVEGEWDDGKYVFRRVGPEDYDSVIKHVQDYFLHDEPTSKLLGYTDDFGEELGEIVKQFLADDLSFLVEEKETGEIAAVRVTYRHTPMTILDDSSIKAYQTKVLLRLCDLTDRMAGLFETFGLDEYAEFFMASCAPQHRRRGITTEMYIRNMKFLKAEGFKLAKSLFTSPYTRAAVTKLGFKEVCRIDYRDLYDDEGNLAFQPSELKEEQFAAVMVIEL